MPCKTTGIIGGASTGAVAVTIPTGVAPGARPPGHAKGEGCAGGASTVPGRSTGAGASVLLFVGSIMFSPTREVPRVREAASRFSRIRRPFDSHQCV